MILFDNAGLPPFRLPMSRGLHQLYVGNIDGSDLRQLTDDPLGASHGSWSPDGTKVVVPPGAYRLTRPFTAELMVLDVATGRPRGWRTARPEPSRNPFFSADGNDIMFTRPGSIPTPGDGEPQADLWKISVDGGDPQVVARGPRIRGLLARRSDDRVPPDGPLARWNNVANYGELWISDADGSDARRLAPSGGFGGQGRWSPNGRWIFYGRYGPPHFTRGPVQVLDMSTGRSIVLSAGSGQDWVDDETLIVVNEAL